MSQLIEKIKEIAQKNTLAVIGNRHHLHQTQFHGNSSRAHR
jgi:hypothetical protein